MGRKRSSIRDRASSIIRSPLTTIHQGRIHILGGAQSSSQSSAGGADAFWDEKSNGLDRTLTSSTNGQAGNGVERPSRGLDVRPAVRTIPPRVRPYESLRHGIIKDGVDPAVAPGPLSDENWHRSHAKRRKRSHSAASNEEDLEGEWHPPWPGACPDSTTSRWVAFKEATAYPSVTPNGGQRVSSDWLRRNGPDYDQPWLAGSGRDGSEDGMAGMARSRLHRAAWYLRLQRTILRSPIVPMVIRMIVFGFSVVALGLACSIYHLTNLENNVVQSTPSTDMAIIVDAVACVYLLYITYDEYSGKPLGLRSTTAKLRLIFLDLFFIVFDSSNLSLAFETIRNHNCHDSILDTACSSAQSQLFRAALLRQKALASVLLIALIAWLMTFSISIARLVERITGR